MTLRYYNMITGHRNAAKRNDDNNLVPAAPMTGGFVCAYLRNASESIIARIEHTADIDVVVVVQLSVRLRLHIRLR